MQTSTSRIRNRIFGVTATAQPAVETELVTPPVSEPAAPIWTPIETSPVFASPTADSIPCEQELLATCHAAIDPDDGHRIGNDKKERRLAELFDQLTSVESLTLHKRLSNPRLDDELAMAFDKRLSTERRKRLLAYLGSAKRRFALGR